MHILLYILAGLAAFVIVPPAIAALARAWKPGTSLLGKSIWVWSWPLMGVWQNPEDGVDGGQWYIDWLHQNGYGDWPQWRRALYWSAFRNKVSGLRYLGAPWSFKVDPARVRGRGNNSDLYVDLTPAQRTVRQWSIARQGCFAGLWIVFTNGRQLRVGYALVPADGLRPYDAANLRLRYCPLTVQLNRNW